MLMRAALASPTYACMPYPRPSDPASTCMTAVPLWLTDLCCVHVYLWIGSRLGLAFESLADTALRRGNMDAAIMYTERGTRFGGSSHRFTNLYVR